jgi:hypothetical protein
MTLLLNPRLWIALALAGVLAFSHFTAYRKGKQTERLRSDAVLIAQEREVHAQTARNLELQRAAEKRYVVQQDARDRFIVTTVREISDAASPLAACPVPESVRVRLNAVRACALGNSASSCGADDPLHKP